MFLIGIIAENNDFKFIKKELDKRAKNNLTVIRIVEKNIENMKNIKYDIIVICKEIDDFDGKEKIFKQILDNAKYLIINTDASIDKEKLSNAKFRIMTYGLNGKATLTISSIGEEEIILCLQRVIENLEKDLIEPNEISIKCKKIDNNKIYNLMVVHAILVIY
jgi:hypothetical protein